MIDSLNNGGAQRQIINLAIEFKRKGHDVVLMQYNNTLNFFKDEINKVKLKTIQIPKKNYLFKYLTIRKLIRKNEYDIVLSFLPYPNFYSIISSLPNRKWKLIIGERSSNPNILKFGINKFIRISYIFADSIVANSYSNITTLRKSLPIIPKEKCEVIYNMLDLEKWTLNNNYQINKNKKTIIVIPARIHANKNILGVIKAISLLSPAEKKQLKVKWYGRSYSNRNLLNNAKNLINELELKAVFEIKKESTNIQHIISEADAVGLFSFHEGLPNAICEGMASGKPIISSLVSDIPLLIKEANLLCDPYDLQSICKAIRYLLSLPPQRLKEIGEENRRTAECLFDKEKIVNSYLELMTKK